MQETTGRRPAAIFGWVLVALGAGSLIATGFLAAPVLATLGPVRVTWLLDVPWRAAALILAGLALLVTGSVILGRPARRSARALRRG